MLPSPSVSVGGRNDLIGGDTDLGHHLVADHRLVIRTLSRSDNRSVQPSLWDEEFVAGAHLDL